MNRKLIYIFSLLLGISLAAGCEQKTVKRQYQEILVEAPQKMTSADDSHAFMQMMPDDDIHANLSVEDVQMQRQLDASVDRSPLNWQTPQGWNETKGSGMRVVTFHSGEGNMAVETTVISLGGKAGGLSSNIARWLQQINVNVPSPEAMEKFISGQEKFKTADGMAGIVIDITQLQKQAPANSPSMIAAVIDGGDSQIFIKMTGTKDAVSKNRASFESLSKSMQKQ